MRTKDSFLHPINNSMTNDGFPHPITTSMKDVCHYVSVTVRKAVCGGEEDLRGLKVTVVI